MRKYLIFFIIFLLTFSIIGTVYADDVNEEQVQTIKPAAIACSECGKGVLLQINRKYIGQETHSIKRCWYTGCYTYVIDNVYQITYKCNYCGAIEQANDYEFFDDGHTLKH